MPETTRGWTKRWKLPGVTRRPGDPLMDSVLHARGIHDPAAFLTPSLMQMHAPSLMPGLDTAATRILQAIRSRESVVIYGDYDVDGVTASAILVHACRALDPEWAEQHLTTYIPHRVEEGYGINSAALKEFARSGVNVVVSVDCGITAIEPATAAAELGLCLIITDHHNFEPKLPEAHALVHPGLPGSAYPYRDLCGAGVAYKLAWRLCEMSSNSERLPDSLRKLLIDLLAFASLGTIADVVPLIDENRAIARFGLSRVRNSGFLGLQALVHASGLDGEKIDAEDVGFKLAPRLNAVGRLGHAKQALELFTTDDPERAALIARSLSQVNDQRREREREIFEAACELVSQQGFDKPDKRAIVLAGDWHPGVIGIVASRLVERFGRPTILLSTQAELLKGSGRSIDGYNLHAALGRSEVHLTRFGGHDAAAGLALEREQLEPFTESLLADAHERLAPEELAQAIEVDLEAHCSELTPAAVRSLDALKPFGRSNPPVRVLLRGVQITAPPETFGQRGAHLALRLAHDGTRPLRAIAWRWGDKRSDLIVGSRIDVVVRAEISSYTGQVEPVIEDIATN